MYDEIKSDYDLPFNPNEIDISIRQISLYYLIKRLKEGSIILDSEIQRKRNLWNWQKQSRLIESLLIRIPIPSFYFDCTDEDRWQIVDGLQRVSTFLNYIVEEKFELQGLEFLPQYNGCTFTKLPRELQRRIEETNITINLINRGTPEEIKYVIFERLNTGGISLRAQELRHVLNPGLPAKFIEELAEMDSFKTVTKGAVNPERMGDRELVNRFVAFYLFFEEYSGNMEAFLNKAMNELYRQQEKLPKIKKDFDKSMRYSFLIFGSDAFRRYKKDNRNKKAFNKALFDTISVNFARLSESELELIASKNKFFRQRFEMFFDLNEFNASISAATSSKRNVNVRMTIFRTFLNDFLND